MNDFKFQWHRALLESALHDTAKLIGVALWDYADRDGCRAYPGNQLIANRLGKSVRTVKAHLKVLRDAGWIERTQASRNVAPDRRSADEYRLLIPAAKVQSSLHLTEAPKVQPGGPPKVQPGAPKVQGSLHPNRPLRTRKEEQGASFGTPPWLPRPEAPVTPSRSTASPVPAEFSISAGMKSWAAKRVPAVNLELQTEKFRNHYEAKGTTGFRYLEPLWRNWMLTANERALEDMARRNPGVYGTRPAVADPTNGRRLNLDYDTPELE